MTTATERTTAIGRAVFTRVLVGIDGSQQALEAARQAARLRAPDGQLTLLAAWSLAPPIIGATGSRVPYYFDQEIQEGHGANALAAARDHVAPVSTVTGKLVRGTAWDELIREIERDRDTLVAVGSSGLGRLRGIVEGSVATEIIHKAPCSVLVARQAGDRFPDKIVVGVDGSVESAAAYAAARSLADRLDAQLTPLVAWGGKTVDRRMIETIAPTHEDSADDPATALTEAARSHDLVVVGSRGLHGPRALGSVSERVAHRAAASVLVVREPAWQQVMDMGRLAARHERPAERRAEEHDPRLQLRGPPPGRDGGGRPRAACAAARFLASCRPCGAPCRSTGAPHVCRL